MIQGAIYILAFLIVVGLVFWVLSMIPGIPDPIRKIIYIILVVIVVIALVAWMLQYAGGVSFGPGPPLYRR
jgi:hypothetical protein